MSVDFSFKPGDPNTVLITGEVDVTDIVTEAEDPKNRANPNNVTNEIWQRCIEQINEASQTDQLNKSDAEIDADPDLSPNEKAQLKAARPTGGLRDAMKARVPARQPEEPAR